MFKFRETNLYRECLWLAQMNFILWRHVCQVTRVWFCLTRIWFAVMAQSHSMSCDVVKVESKGHFINRSLVVFHGFILHVAVAPCTKFHLRIHLAWAKMGAVIQTILSDEFSRIKSFEVWIIFHGNVFLAVLIDLSVSIGWGCGLEPAGFKPLPQPMLTRN